MGFIIKPMVTEKMTKITDKSEVMIAAQLNSYKVLNADVLVITENSLKVIDGILTK